MIASPYGSTADRLRHAVGWTATPAAAAPVCATCDYRAQVSAAGHACLSVPDTAFATTLDAGCDRWRPRALSTPGAWQGPPPEREISIGRSRVADQTRNNRTRSATHDTTQGRTGAP